MDRSRQLCFEINSTAPNDKEKIVELENELLDGQMKDGTFFTPPFQVDLADNSNRQILMCDNSFNISADFAERAIHI